MKRLRRSCFETRPRALSLAAIRETCEETGLLIGELERRLREGAGPETCGPFVYTRYGKSVIESM